MLAKKVGIAPEAVADTLIAEMGHSGAAHPLVMLSAVLEKARPGERILLASFGQGCDLLLIEVTDAIGSIKPRLGVSGWLARRIDSANYARYLFHRRSEEHTSELQSLMRISYAVFCLQKKT